MWSPPRAGPEGWLYSPAPSSPCHSPAFLGEVRLEAKPGAAIAGPSGAAFENRELQERDQLLPQQQVPP